MVVSFNMIIINIDQISYLSPSVVATTAWSSLSPQQWDFEQKNDIQVGYSVLLDCKDRLWGNIPFEKVSLQTINDFIVWRIGLHSFPILNTSNYLLAKIWQEFFLVFSCPGQLNRWHCQSLIKSDRLLISATFERLLSDFWETFERLLRDF